MRTGSSVLATERPLCRTADTDTEAVYPDNDDYVTVGLDRVGHHAGRSRENMIETRPSTRFPNSSVYDSSKSFLWTELRSHLATGSSFQPPTTADRYELIKYAHIDALGDIEEVTPGAFALDIPISVFAPRCNLDELRSMCDLHRITVPIHSLKAAVLDLICTHVCEGCDDYFPVFVPCSFCADLQALTYPQKYLDSLVLKVKKFSLDDLRSFVVVSDALQGAYDQGARLRALSLIGDGGKEACVNTSPNSISVPAPWLKIARKGSLPVIHFIAKVHGVPLLSRVSKGNALRALDVHQCNLGCQPYQAVFLPFSESIRSPAPVQRVKVSPESSFVLDLETPCDPVYPYPPKAFSSLDSLKIVTSFCEDVRPSRFEESGCSVCGQLTLLSDLVDLEDIQCSLAPLIERGLVRVERTSSTQRPSYDNGPVLDLSRSRSCCSSCLKALKKGKRPARALANGLWLGDVPACLAQLTFAEQCLVARVRTNRCVMRVSCGQSKMMANAISFPCPTVKVYKLLPPRRDDLDEVLACIFTGPNAPTEEDLGRTPMLVRRNLVADALNWLRMNHVDYLDLDIDYSALNSYPLHGIPVQVLYKAVSDGSNVLASAMSVHDVGEEHGTDSGDCPLTVNGLVGSHLDSMSLMARKTAAIQHLRAGGCVLAVGRSDSPESVFDNPQLYPQMYPWLFPYGIGGFGNARLRGIISEASHKKWMLMYHDKRFQTDARFIIVAFNHEQIKRGTTGSFLMSKRSNFNTIASRVSQLNPAVIANISNRLKEGQRVIPCNDEERACFALLDQVDHVGGAIQGSISGKKNMRKELWSLVTLKGAPSWFITLSPADNRHPICIYWSDKNVKFSPSLREASDRVRLVARNPVAGARFFHYMVQLFIKHLLRWGGSDDGHQGVFGNTAAYYGTVEQQGRMTLHLHMLVWVSCALSPQDLKEKLMSGDSEFVCDLIDYLESCQIGEFVTGTKKEVEERFRRAGQSSQSDPTQSLPVPPPARAADACTEVDCRCAECSALQRWLAHYQETIDRVLLSSNVHTCYVRRDVLTEGVKRKHVTGKGCLNKDGVCTARFPREIIQRSSVDLEGRLSLKKLEPMINSVNQVMCYCFGCNTDCTCLLSGTAVKATVGYVADYIVKMGLKTHQIFSSIYDVFERNATVWEDSKDGSDGARRLILKMANSLTSKMEIGGPMAAMYLLGNPDHYSSHSFVLFYWKPYVLYVEGAWGDAITFGGDSPSKSTFAVGSSFDADVHNDPTCLDADEPEAEEDSVVLARSQYKIYGSSRVDDYRMRPVELLGVCLYDWIQCAQRIKLGGSPFGRCLRYAEGHPLRETHGVSFDVERMIKVVPNFAGPYLPRVDGEDREFYCRTMMTLFVPWTTGLDLKSSDSSWSEAFGASTFSPRHMTVMGNMNIRYECYDARDDFHAQLRVRVSAQHDGTDIIDVEDPEFDVVGPDTGDCVDVELEDGGITGAWCKRKAEQMKEVEAVLEGAGWIKEGGGNDAPLPGVPFCPGRMMPPSQWKDLVARERKKVLSARVCAATEIDDDLEHDVRPMNDARIIPGSYLLSEFRLCDVEVAVHTEDVVLLFSLNEEQERAFRIVANHSLCISPDPLRMYIGGMGGTGKTQVIKALLHWFDLRGEGHRMVILAPTGAAASIVNGSTYHSYLGVKTGDRKGTADRGTASLDAAREKMTGVDYVFLDEISMVSCQDLFLIDARLKEITRLDDLPFGGVSMIVAGDFAQLPPAKGQTLYSGQVSKTQNARQVLTDQENTLGMLVWHQFVVVVILVKNMRQQALTPSDTALRRALVHMRYKDCDDADVQFLRSLVPSHNPHLNLGDAMWRDVSVITALNVHKDQINVMNAHRFALSVNSPLHMFYSVDKQAQPRASSKTPKKAPSEAAQGIRMTESVQRSLWKAHPHSSEHIAGCLPLCVGMPVMIRHNEATELCMTKGQEAIVKGWTSHEHPLHPGYHVLAVLFVELVNPPKSVSLPHLPVNTVPLTRVTTAVKAILPNDLAINVSRQQIPVLLNFAMTDYASQGKTRDVNIVDLKHCRNHQAMYTCLSRGKFAEKTAILRDFDVRKIRGGLSGFLREEFRTLDILNRITEEHYSGRLPPTIMQRLRGSTIIAYRAWCRAGNAIERPMGRRDDIAVAVGEVGKCEEHGDDPRPSKRRKLFSDNNSSQVLPVFSGWEWDAISWSCAYDSVLTVLRNVWTDCPQAFGGGVGTEFSYVRYLGRMFRSLQGGRVSLNSCRSSLRARLWGADPVTFPKGRTGTDLISLTLTLFDLRVDSLVPNVWTCAKCGVETSGSVLERVSSYTVMRSDLSDPVRVSHYLASLYAASRACLKCGGDVRLQNEQPLMMCVQLPDASNEAPKTHLVIDRRFHIAGAEYVLAGIVYWGSHDRHFAARVLRSPDRVYRYDGMIQQGNLRYDKIASMSGHNTTTLSSMDGRVASQAFFWKK